METTGILTLVGGVVVVVITWILNEWGKRVYEERKRREELYRGLVESFKGFLVLGAARSEVLGLREKFVGECRLSWLYCSDEVVCRENEFLGRMAHLKDSTNGDETGARTAAEAAASKLMLAIRRDLVGWWKTDLEMRDFKLYTATSFPEKWLVHSKQG